MATDYRAQFQGDLDSCRMALSQQNLPLATMYYAMAKASHAGMVEMKVGDQGSSLDAEGALNGMDKAIQMLREVLAQDQSGGAVAYAVGRPHGVGGSGQVFMR